MDPEPKSPGVHGTPQRKFGLCVARAAAAQVLPLSGLRPCFGHEVPNRQYQLSRGGPHPARCACRFDGLVWQPGQCGGWERGAT
jgi:hypothetical protein